MRIEQNSLQNSNRLLISLVFSTIMIGVYATIAQTLMFREFLAVFYGNELCIGLILGAWLFGVAFGAWIGGRISSETASLDGCLHWFITAFIAMSVMLPVQTGLLRVFRGFLDIPTGQAAAISSVIFTASAIIIPASIAIGFIFPLACVIFSKATSAKSRGIGNVYILEGVGSLIAGVIFTFLLAPRYLTFEIIAIFNIVNFIALFFLLICLKDRLKKTRFVVCALLAIYTVLFLSSSATGIDKFLAKKRWATFNDSIKLVESIDSKYGNIVIGEKDGQYSAFVNGQYDFSFPDEYGNAQISHLVMNQHPDPQNVLLVGGGLGSLINEMLKHPVRALDYVELDQELIRLTKKYLGTDDVNALSDKRVAIHNVDGRFFIKSSKARKYDMIFSNTPDPSTASLNRFYTVEFFREAKARLRKGGVFVARADAALNYFGADVAAYAGSVYHALTAVFPYIKISPGSTNYFFCSNDKNTVNFDLDVLGKRHRERNIESDYFSEYNFYTILQPEQVAAVKERYQNLKISGLNTDHQPLTYFFNLVLWGRYTGSRFADFFRLLGAIDIIYYFAPIFIFLLFRLAYIEIIKNRANYSASAGAIRGKPLNLISRCARFNSLAAISSLGFTGIALEIIIIFEFQNVFGYIYEKIGLVVAIFMFGLALGAVFANRIVKKYETLEELNLKDEGLFVNNNLKFWTKRLLAVEIFAALLLPTIPFIFKVLPYSGTSSLWILFLLIAIAGIMTGFGFPLGGKLFMKAKLQNIENSHLKQGSGLSITAGMVDAADHFGAFIGAVLTGVILAPILGISGACFVIAAVNLTVAVLLAHFIIRR